MDHRPPRGSSNKKGCKNVPPEKPSSMNFCHPQFPQNLFSQPAYAMNYPFPPFPHYPPPYTQNFQYAVPPQYGPYSLPPPAGAMPSPYLPGPAMPSKAVSDQDTPHSVTGPGEHDVDNAEPEKTAKRLMWTEEEDIRLISAWLVNFNADKYWEKIAAEYNSTTPGPRRRELQHLKGHWHKIAKKLARFNDCWCRVKARYPSGQSESMQLMDKTWLMCKEEAHAVYLEEAKRNFTLGHCWKAVWDQPKWKEYISCLWTKRTMRSESEDYMSSSEDTEDMPGKEIGQQVFMTYKDGKAMASTSSSEVPENIKDCEDTTEVQPSVSNQQLLLLSSKQPNVRDKDTEVSMKQSEPLTADASWPMEFSLGSHQLIADSSKLNEHQQGMAVRHDIVEKESRPQGFEVLDHDTVARDHTSNKEIQTGGFKSQMVSRKRKGKASSSSCEVQEDIKHVVYLQKMLNNDREKMSEVQLRLSKEQLELARIKHEEAKERKEATLYKKYTELLLAHTSKFDEFQKAEYERAVRHIGEMLFNKDGN